MRNALIAIVRRRHNLNRVFDRRKMDVDANVPDGTVRWRNNEDHRRFAMQAVADMRALGF